MLLTHIDYLIGLDIMGYTPAPVNQFRKKNRAESVRTLWTNDKNERFYFHPSSSAEHSRQLIHHMAQQNYEFRIYYNKQKWICSFSKNESHFGVSSNDNEAICLAALKAFVEDSTL
ncbi:hypothetical protein CN918_32270 [Priestia megaterium]|nr:hypothetical protein CN918_32270 [Priestia megaterium]